MGTYDSQMQRIHDTAKALDEAGCLELAPHEGNMESYRVHNDTNGHQIGGLEGVEVYRKADVDAALAEIGIQRRGQELLSTKLRQQLAAATKRNKWLEEG